MDIIYNQFKNSKDFISYVDHNYEHDDLDKIKVILKIGYEKKLLAKMKSKKDITCEKYLNWFFSKYDKSIKLRSENRIGQPMATKNDNILNHIMENSLGYDKTEIEKLINAHRIAMISENIIGSLLEEYIEKELEKTDWIYCCAELLQKSDFCHPDGTILQIKNSDNTENSSSKKIRNKTDIKLWFRFFSKKGKTNWDDIYFKLNSIKKGSDYLIDGNIVEFSEKRFKKYISNILKKNPSLIYT